MLCKYRYSVSFKFDVGEKYFLYNDLNQIKEDILHGNLNIWFRMCKEMYIDDNTFMSDDDFDEVVEELLWNRTDN